MTAKITLEFDDQTAPGFQSLVKSLQTSEQATGEMTQAASVNNQAMAQMQNQHALTAQALKANTAAVIANRDSWIENANAMFEFGRNLTDVGLKVGGAAIATAKYTAAVAEAKAGVDAKRLALRQLGLRLLGIGRPVLGATLAFKGFAAIADRTGKRVVAVSDDVSEATRRLAAEVTAGHKTIQEVLDETGASLEELGLKAETNYTRMSEATSKMARSVGRDLKLVLQEAFELTGIPERARENWEALDERFTQFAENTESNAELVREAFDKLLGRSTELRKEQEKLAEIAEREEPMRKRAQQFEKTLARESELETELADIRRLGTREEVQNRLTAERQKREELIKSFEFRGDVEKASNARVRALLRQEEALRQKSLDQVKEIAKAQADFMQKIHEKELKDAEEAQAKAVELRRQAAEKLKQIEEEFQRGQDSLATQEELKIIELAKKRQELIGDREEQILQLEKEAARVRAREAIANSKSEEETIRLAFALTRELRELDLAHDLAMKDKKAAAARAAAEKEIEAERQKIEALKGLRNAQGQNAFQSIAARQSRADIIKELARRHQTGVVTIQRQLQSGKINGVEVQKVQADLAARQILQAQKQGRVSKEAFRALGEQAKQTQEQIKLNEEMINQFGEFREFMNQINKTNKGQQQRLRAQRKGLRG